MSNFAEIARPYRHQHQGEQFPQRGAQDNVSPLIPITPSAIDRTEFLAPAKFYE